MNFLFVYGTLKRGGTNHGQMAGQRFVAEARTIPGYRMFDVGGFPGLVAWPEDREGVTGEIWLVSPAALLRLDGFEGVHEGLYRRETVALAGPPLGEPIEAYLYARSVEGLQPVGHTWRD